MTPLPPESIACDLLIIGGGINGAGIARDAAGRGLSVVLCDKDDLGAHTSSASTKLIHGGLRYLEQYDFKLVRKALAEREVLLRAAPHIIRPLRFVMPHDTGQRPAWMIRAGLFLYDHLAKRVLLPSSRGVNLQRHFSGQPLQPQFKRAFAYSDAWVDDARLVILNAIDAADHGAKILPRTACTGARRDGAGWHATLHSNALNQTINVQARALVNAAGPWAASLQQTLTQQAAATPMRLIKGSHIVVKRLFEHPFAYIFQHPDGRIVFAIPYEGEYTLIGTTDIEFSGDANDVRIEQEEIDYLCTLANRYFRQPISAADVVWSYSGVRPLIADDAASAATVTRDYHFTLDRDADQQRAPLLTIFGGKITTFRKLAEEAVDLLAPLLGNHHGAWSGSACLPGGDLFGPAPHKRSVLEFDGYVQALCKLYPWLPAHLVTRYARAYGNRIHVLLKGRTTIPEMGQEIAPELFAAEAEYWIQHEWAHSAADMLWRRSKLGLHVPADTAEKLDAWIAAQATNRFNTAALKYAGDAQS